MAVNINDRRRVSTLIQDEYRSRINAATQEPTEAEIAAEMDAIISKNRLKDKVEKLQQARGQVNSLEKSLSAAVVGLRPMKKRSRRYDDCECHENYSEVLKELAAANLIAARKPDATREKLKSEERRLLAQVEVAKAVGDLEKIVKQAGLI
jgi:hypothetical protein